MKEEKIYRCDYCKEPFSDPESCKRHEQWHTMPLDLALKILEQVRFHCKDNTYCCHPCPCWDIPSTPCSSCLNAAKDRVLAEIKGKSN